MNLNQGSSGNLSVRIPEGLFITPSSVPYEELTTSDILAIDFSGNLLNGENEHRAKQNLKPSSEWKLHCRILRERKDVNAVLHCHSINATAIACHARGIPSFHYMTAIAGGDDIKCATYNTFGTEQFAQGAIKALNNRFACLLANHGQVAISGTLKNAMKIALEVETLASIFLKSLQLGEPKYLTSNEMETVLLKFKEMSYGGE